MSSPAFRRAWRAYRHVTPLLDRCFLWGSVTAAFLLVGAVVTSGTPPARVFASLLLLHVIQIFGATAVLLCVTGYALYGALVGRSAVAACAALGASLLGASAVCYLLAMIVSVAWTPVMGWVTSD